ncbi:gluconate 2-dehydrogenase subunit 3 family protein [Spirosoma sp.]|uniref:gluconate 2-dehydrogenase subunit 3 family protein n=1 Tax=Spirosoma sp. TaxID=1899569 RepID=UPI00262D666D|nr:gluconate 2-dehydrogenase subunit 3 family protein [Spirosoma sp.]MCX6216325.1 gluconate 2-dehydrogenase subunit 3 family protein [Spirosoma sp.]
MQRRYALKGLAMSLGGLVSLPAWASGWTGNSLGSVSLVSFDEQTLLGEIVETFIPETNTPGAKSLNVHQFALRMIKDCFGEAAQTTLKHGLDLTETTAQQTYTKAFADCDAPKRRDILLKLAASTDPAGKAFIDMIKRLTIQGYTNSEYYLVNVQKFNMAPGFYHGCVPVPKLAVSGTK